MKSLKVRDIFTEDKEKVWSIPEGDYLVEYEDGNIVRSHKEAIIMNRYCWEVIKLYPLTPITVSCDVITLIGDGYFNISTPVKILERIFGHICDANNIVHFKEKEPILREVYNVANLIFNDIVQRVSDSVTTLDAVDFVDIVKSEEIMELHDKLIPYPESVELTYRGIKQYMTSANTDNKLVAAYRAKAINENQANQCIGPRGFVTDLDRTVFKQPIMSGFIRGMSSLYELMTESRTAAKSLNATEDSIRSSEYASRRIQLMSMVVTGSTDVDCGSQDYLTVVMNEKYLANMKDKWYKVNDGDELDYIRGDETHLIGKPIKVRWVVGCKTPDPSKVCTKCVGRLSENIPTNSNLGYTFSASIMEKLTQALLSTKHLTQSVRKSAIKLEGAVLNYMYSTDENEIYLNKDLDLTNLALVLPSNRLSKLTDVLSLDHTNVALNKIGELEVVGIRRLDKKTNESVNVSYKDRYSNISKDFLVYIKETDFEITPRGDYIVPLANFDKSKPLFGNSLKESDILAFVRDVASQIEVTAKGQANLSITEHFFKLADTVYDQLNVNMSALEIIVYASSAFNVEDDNFRLSRKSPVPQQAARGELFRNRSMSQLLVFEKQKGEFRGHAPKVFSNRYRSDHPLDVLFVPSEVINQK